MIPSAQANNSSDRHILRSELTKMIMEENYSSDFECDIVVPLLKDQNDNDDDEQESPNPGWKGKCTPRRVVCHTFMLLVAMGLIFTGLLFVPWFVEMMYRYIMQHELVLDPNSQMYDDWAHPTLPMYQSLYFMDLQNPDDVIRGEKPKVVERGPYVYRMTLDRDNVTFNDNDTVSYLLRYRYYFDEDRSVGPETDTVTLLNAPLITTAYMMRDYNFLVRSAVKGVLYQLRENMVVRKSVGEVVWGYEDPLFDMVHRFVAIPGFDSGQFGYFVGLNTSYVGQFTVHTGKRNMSLTNRIDKVDGAENLPFWWSNYSNNIKNSSDGSKYHPGIEKGETLHFYQPQLCRSVSYNFVNETKFKGIPVLKFGLSPSTYMNATAFGPNSGFCSGNPDLCGPSGVMRQDPCRFGSPMAISNPHFLGGQPSLVDSIDGLSPNETLHQNYMEVEPKTGIPLAVKFRMQINMYIKPVQGMKDMSRIREMYMPLLWMEQSVEADDHTVARFKLGLVDVWYVALAVQWLLFGVGVLVLIVLLAKTVRIVADADADADKEKKQKDANENEPAYKPSERLISVTG